MAGTIFQRIVNLRKVGLTFAEARSKDSITFAYPFEWDDGCEEFFFLRGLFECFFLFLNVK